MRTCRDETTVRNRRRRAVPPDLNVVAADWLTAAIPSPGRLAGGADAIVHDFRTAAKRARALVRLFADALGRSMVRSEDRRLRDAARALAPARDAAVARALLHKLRRKHRGRTAAAFAAAQRGIANPPSAVLTPGKMRAGIARAHATLLATAERLRWLRLTPSDAGEAIEAGLRASYRRSRHQMRRAGTTGTAAEFHAWRKLAKRLLHQLQVPGLAKSKTGQRLVRRLDELQERLGAEHDTQLVMGLLRTAPARFGGMKNTARVIAVLEDRGRSLRSRCLRLGAKVLPAKPAAFAKAIRRQLRHLRAEVKPS